MNRGRHLRAMLRQAGFDVSEFLASYASSTTPQAVQSAVQGYIDWMEHVPLFAQAIALGWVDRSTLEEIEAGMRQWSKHPDALLALGRCKAIGRKTS